MNCAELALIGEPRVQDEEIEGLVYEFVPRLHIDPNSFDLVLTSSSKRCSTPIEIYIYIYFVYSTPPLSPQPVELKNIRRPLVRGPFRPRNIRQHT